MFLQVYRYFFILKSTISLFLFFATDNPIRATSSQEISTKLIHNNQLAKIYLREKTLKNIGNIATFTPKYIIV